MNYDVILFTDLQSVCGHSKPLAAYRLATELRNSQFTVKVIDYAVRWFTDKNLLFELLQTIVGPNTLFIGFSSTFFSSLPSYHGKYANEEIKFKLACFDNILTNYPCPPQDFLDITKKIKNDWPTVKLVYGGSRTNQIDLKVCETIDFVVNGFADYSIIALARHLKFGTGLSVKKSSHDPCVIDHDMLAADLNFRNCVTSYQETDHIRPGEVLSLETSRGCMFKCKFCSYPLLGRKKNDLSYHKTTETIAKELEENWKKYRVQNYIFTDDTLNETTEKLQQIYQAIKTSGVDLRFSAFVRLDLLERFPEQIPLLKKMGLRSVFFGLESLNDESLKVIGKGIKSEKIIKPLNLCRKEWPEINIHTNYIIGLPKETPDTLNNWINWVISDDNPADSFRFNTLRISRQSYWQSEFSIDPFKFGYVLKDNGWANEIWDSKQVDKLVYEYTKKAYLSKRLKIGDLDVMNMVNLGYTFENIKYLSYNDLNLNKLYLQNEKIFRDYVKSLFDFEKLH